MAQQLLLARRFLNNKSRFTVCHFCPAHSAAKCAIFSHGFYCHGYHAYIISYGYFSLSDACKAFNGATSGINTMARKVADRCRYIGCR